MATKKAEVGEIVVSEVKKSTVILNVVGTTPLICNRLSEKARRELLLPAPKKNAAAKQSALKHDPIAEFRASPYMLPDEDAPTLLAVMSSAFKGAMSTAALDLPGTNKTQVGRLVYVEGDYVPVYGIPQLLLSVVRCADPNRTPDIRSRAIIPKWACQIEISFVTPLLKVQSVVNLLAAGGVTAGIGDWRPEKGKGNYGQFRIANDDDPELLEILETGGRKAQMEAMAKPVPYDAETEALLEWFVDEYRERGLAS